MYSVIPYRMAPEIAVTRMLLHIIAWAASQKGQYL